MTFSIPEPPLAEDDTRRRLAAATASAPVSDPPPVVEPIADEPRGGCGRLILPAVVLLAFAFLCVAMVGLSGFAGYRDGVNDAVTHIAATRVVVVATQLVHIQTDLQNGNWYSALTRCQYVATQNPNDPQIAQCLDQAQKALSATPTPAATSTPTATHTPISTSTPSATVTPNVPPTATINGTAAFLDSLWSQAQDALKKNDFSTAIADLEALREYDATYNPHQVLQTLCSTYESQGQVYEANNQLSEMVVVINKGFKLNCVYKATDWSFTIDVVELYLSAKGYAGAGDYADADRVFNKLMPIDPTYLDTKQIACDTFSKAGDTTAFNQYCK